MDGGSEREGERGERDEEREGAGEREGVENERGLSIKPRTQAADVFPRLLWIRSPHRDPSLRTEKNVLPVRAEGWRSERGSNTAAPAFWGNFAQ